MATHKRVDGTYYIETINNVDNVEITTHTVKVFGNLDVQGNITYIDTTELDITDPFITLAANNTGLYSNVGILAQKSSGPNTYASLRWNTTSGTWQVSPDNSTFVNIATGNVATTPGGANTNIQFNNVGSFGGNVNYSFDVANAQVTLQGHQVFGNIATAPSAVANSVAVYHNITGSGGTGLYVKSPSVQDELVSKSKAIVFAIIF
jgi:hypothetical protein